MNKLIILFIFIPLFSIGQTQTLKVELIDYTKDKIPAYCGYQTEWGILKFKVFESTENFEKGQIIFGIFQCPRETMKSVFKAKNYINNREYLLTIGKMVEKNEIEKINTTNIFNENRMEKVEFPFWLVELEELK